VRELILTYAEIYFIFFFLFFSSGSLYGEV